MKRISILGSTGSIGTNCLNVLESQDSCFEVSYLTSHKNIRLLFEQAVKFRPKAVAILKEDQLPEFSPSFKEIGVDVYTGFEGILDVSAKDDVDIVVNALVGAVGLKPTLSAIKKNVRIALANKETLVIGGQFVMEKARREGAEVIPIDSEHSALLQCLAGEDQENIKCVILTASGGPFREFSAEELSDVTVEQALNHPNWDMGPKVTIDSATLMNKGLEVIEAHWFFNLPPAEIQVVVHPQSIIHSMVEFNDGSIKAQLGLPDMRIPIQYALTYPDRLAADFPRLDFRSLRELTFEQPDFEKFPCLQLSYDALEIGGAAPAVMNAANEEAVSLFLSEKIAFNQISDMVAKALAKFQNNKCESVEDLLQFDKVTREFVLNGCN